MWCRIYILPYTHYTAYACKHNCILKDLLNKGTVKVFQRVGKSFSICETFSPRTCFKDIMSTGMLVIGQSQKCSAPIPTIQVQQRLKSKIQQRLI